MVAFEEAGEAKVAVAVAVAVAIAVTVGAAAVATQEQTASADDSACRAVAMPHALITQFDAALAIADAAEVLHWHAKLVDAHPTAEPADSTHEVL